MIGPRADLGTLLAERAAALGDREFLTVISRDPAPSHRTLSYREFNAEVNRVARGLAHRGVGNDSFVALMLPNALEYLLVSWALKKLGAVEVGINSEFRGDALGRIIAMTEPRVLITANEFADVLGPVLPDIDALEMVVIIDEKPVAAPAWAGKQILPLVEILSEDESNPEKAVGDDADLCLIIFTSGSTGLSKRCMLSQSLGGAYGGVYRRISRADRARLPVHLLSAVSRADLGRASAHASNRRGGRWCRPPSACRASGPRLTSTGSHGCACRVR